VLEEPLDTLIDVVDHIERTILNEFRKVAALNDDDSNVVSRHTKNATVY